MYKITPYHKTPPHYDKDDLGRALERAPLGVLLHTDEGTAGSTLDWVFQARSKVSYHYYVTRSGVIYSLLPDRWRAWHGGTGALPGVTGDLNALLGVAFEHLGPDPKRGRPLGQDWPMIQRAAGAWLCRLLIARYRFTQDRIVAHRWVATPPKRKQDPSDWADPELKAWIRALFVPEAEGAHPDVDPDFAASWLRSGGVWKPEQLTPGLPQGPSFVAGGIKMQRFERGLAKLTTEGVVWALLPEALEHMP